MDRVWGRGRKEKGGHLPLQGIGQPKNVEKDLACGGDVRLVPDSSSSVLIIRRPEVAFSSLELGDTVSVVGTFDDGVGDGGERVNGGRSGSDADATASRVGFLDGAVCPGIRHLERGDVRGAVRLGEGHKLRSFGGVIVCDINAHSM